MHKKLLTACLAAFALAAIVLPAAAQAVNNPVITHPTGTVLPTGTKILGTNLGNTTMRNTSDGSVQLTCTKAVMTGTLTENVTGSVKGEISSATFKGTGTGERCTGFVNVAVDPLNLPWCLKANNGMAVDDEFTVTGSGCGAAAKALEFKLTPETGGECVYQATKASIRGTFTTDTSGGDATMRIPRSTLLTNAEKSPETGFTKIKDTSLFSLCPSTSYLEMEFTLETDVEKAEPLYISS